MTEIRKERERGRKRVETGGRARTKGPKWLVFVALLRISLPPGGSALPEEGAAEQRLLAVQQQQAMDSMPTTRNNELLLFFSLTDFLPLFLLQNKFEIPTGKKNSKFEIVFT